MTAKTEASRLTNNQGIDLSLAVWLACDDYNYVDDKVNYISVTTLIKPLRQIILAARVAPEDRIPDIADLVSSRIGQTLHGGVEDAWKSNYRSALKKLGYPAKVIDMVRINPEVVEPDTLPVFTEVRSFREIEGFTVGGQVDLIIEYKLRDVKSTKVWSYQNQAGVGDWKLQGSVYRWLNPEKIQHDEFLIQYLLLDWSAGAVKRDPSYPATACPSRVIQLMSVAETEHYIRQKLQQLRHLWDAPEDQIPLCTDDDLWRTPPKFKYYAKADAPSTGRSTKNFDNLHEALMHRDSQGKGRVDHVPGEVIRCKYCPAFKACTQKDQYLADGSLKL